MHDLLDLLLCGGGVDLDVRVIDQDVVKVGHLQVGPFLAEQKGEAVLECSKIFRPRETVLRKYYLNQKLPCGGHVLTQPAAVDDVHDLIPV